MTDNIHTDEELIIAGDLNGHVGLERRGFDRWHGGKTRGTINADGEKILEFARSSDLALVNTFFVKSDAQSYTFESGPNKTVIDYIMTRRDNLNKIKNCKVIVGEAVATQHRLLVMDYTTIKKRRKRRKREERICWWKLKKEEGDELVEKLEEIMDSIDDREQMQWDATYPKIMKSAKEVLGTSRPGRYLEKESWWWDEEVKEAVKEKKEAFKLWKMERSEEAREDYKQKNKTCKEKCAVAREHASENLYKELEENGPQIIHRLAKTRSRRSKDIDRMPFVRNQEGNILCDGEEIKNRWRGYFDTLLNTENRRENLDEIATVQGPIEEITTTEVKKQLERMKANKATGPDEIPIELVKKLKDRGLVWITEVIRTIIRDGIPLDWRGSITTPIYKNKGDPLDCGNYRGIKLLSHSLKLMERVIEARLREIVTIKKNQYGFQKGKSTTEPMFCLRMIQEKFREYNKPLHMVFVDLEKAYDTIPRELIWHCLRKRGVPEGYVNIIQDMYRDSTTKVSTTSGKTEDINIGIGLHQRSALSSLLFIIIMDVVAEGIDENTPWTMLFADDLVLCDGNQQQLEERLEKWRNVMESAGMKLSRSKTEYLPPPGEHGDIRMREYNSENRATLTKCGEFKYLGTTIQQDGGCQKEVALRISKAWNKWRELTGVLCDRRMPSKLKVLIYKTSVRPALTYGNETWPITGYQADKISVCEMRMLRYCLGISLEEHRRNEEILEEAGVMPIKDLMRKKRMQWYGHVCRREQEEDIRMVYNLRVEGRRSRGRPKQRWSDTVNSDLRWLGLENEDPGDRMRWRSLVEWKIGQKPATRTGQRR